MAHAVGCSYKPAHAAHALAATLTQRAGRAPQSLGVTIGNGLKKAPALLIIGTFVVITLRATIGAWQASPVTPQYEKTPKDKVVKILKQEKAPAPESGFVERIRKAIFETKREVAAQTDVKQSATPTKEEAKQKIAPPKASAQPAYKASSKTFPLSIPKLTGNFIKQAHVAFVKAEQNGLLEDVVAVARHMKHDPAQMLTLCFFESSMGTREQQAKNGRQEAEFIGLTQFGEKPFLEAIGRHMESYLDCMREVEPQEAKRIGYLLKFLDYNRMDSSVRLDQETFSKAHGDKAGSIRAKILDLRKTTKVGKKTSLFLSQRDVDVKLPYVQKNIQGNLSHEAETAIQENGEGFIRRMIHNFGADGAIGLLTAAPERKVQSVIGDLKASSNDWHGVKVGDMITHMSLTYAAVEGSMHDLMREYCAAQTAKLAKAKIPAKPTAAPAAKPAQKIVLAKN